MKCLRHETIGQVINEQLENFNVVIEEIRAGSSDHGKINDNGTVTPETTPVDVLINFNTKYLMIKCREIQETPDKEKVLNPPAQDAFHILMNARKVYNTLPKERYVIQ